MILLVIDTQSLIMTSKLYAFDIVVSNITKLIDCARQQDMEVIYVRHDDGVTEPLTKGKPGFDIYEQFYPRSSELVFDKFVNSPFKETGLLEYLKGRGEQELIVVGLQSDYCINATVLCAFEHGFQVYVPSYANTTEDNAYMSGKQSYQYYNEFLWKDRYATCLSMEEMIEKMKRRSDDGI